MDILSFFTNYILLFVLLMSVLVFVHEFGHYGVARLLGVKAEVFSIGFGPEIVGWTSRKTGTRWRISAIPLGGYVKFLGEMIPGDTDRQNAGIPAEERNSAFHSKAVWKRAAIVFAGPAANLLFAWFLTVIMLVSLGRGFTQPRVGVVEPDGPAARADIRPGDELVSFNGSAVMRYEDFEQEVQIRPNARIEVGVRRDGQLLVKQMTTEQVQFVDRFGNVHRLGKAGLYSPNELPLVGDVMPGTPADVAGIRKGDRVIAVQNRPIERFSEIPVALRGQAELPTVITIERDGRRTDITLVPEASKQAARAGAAVGPRQGRIGITAGYFTEIRQFAPHEAAVAAVHGIVKECQTFYTLLRQLLLGLRPIDELSGPMRMAKATGEVAQIGWPAILGFAIIISVLLGLFNLLPVPLLDGGHLLYYAIEWVRGRPLGPRAQEYGFRFGFLLVVSATVVATWNDVTQIFGHLWR